MTSTDAVNSAKSRLFLTETTDFDSELADFFETAVTRLYPKVQKEMPSQQANVVVSNYGEAFVDLSLLSTPLDDVRDVEASAGYEWQSVENIYRHGTEMRVRGLSTSITQLRLYGLKKYAIVDSEVDLPSYMEPPVIWFMLSEFFDMLSGNKSKFNVYTQQAGGRAVEDMRNEAQYYEVKAEAYIDEKANLYGA